MKIVVSIIIPNFNSERTIISSLTSIKYQTFQSFECIIIDDNSSDNSLNLIEKFISNDQRFVLIKSRKNNGVSFSRNLGISYAKGRYLTFLDSDDIWDKGFLENNLEIRSNKDIPISHSPYIRFKVRKDHLIRGVLVNPPVIINKKNILKKNFLPLLTVFIDTKSVGKIIFRNLRPEDYDLWLDLINSKNFYSISTKKVNCFYRISDTQRSKNKIKSFLRICKFYKRKLKFNNLIAFGFGLRWMYYNLLSRFNIFRDFNYFKPSVHIMKIIKNENN